MATAINDKEIAILLLAAGGSTRLGHAKQLLRVGDRTLLEQCMEAAHGSNANAVVVVLGAYPHLLNSEITENTHIVINANWQEGMASSIQCGIEEVQRILPSASGVIVMVCDQPYVTSALLNKLIATKETTGKAIVACAYGNTFGPPVFFDKVFFPELFALKGDIGAKSIIRQHADDVELILFPEGHIDIDTEEDYQRLLKVKSE